MTTINDLLSQLGVEDEPQVKTAGAPSQSATDDEIEKAARELGLIDNPGQTSTKTASQNNGGPQMNLHDLYNTHFGSEAEKTASATTPSFEKDAAAELEKAGEIAGLSFKEGLETRLFKFAMDTVPDSDATQDRNQGPGVIPGAEVENPQLEVNRPENASSPMDTTPQYTDLLDKAVAKKAIEKALAEGKPGDLSHGVYQVDTGLEMPTDQEEA